MSIDLNADVGEHEDAAAVAAETALFGTVSSVNIACGVHAGGPDAMRRVLALARACGVAAGAHPGYRDSAGFGRVEREVSVREVENLVAYQVGALSALARLEGVALTHVKPHGALYNQAARDRTLAGAIARAVRIVDASLCLVGLAGSALVDAARAEGLRAISEGFIDRGYRADGSLVPRHEPGALVTDPAAAARRAVSLARDGCVMAAAGDVEVRVAVDTLCVHGDTPGALAIARAARAALEAAGLTIASPWVRS